LGLELFLEVKRKRPSIHDVHADLKPFARRLEYLSRDLSYHFKKVSMDHQEEIVTHQNTQARLADAAIYLFAMIAALSKRDRQLKENASVLESEREAAAFVHFFDLAELTIEERFRELYRNADVSLRNAARVSMDYSDSLPNSRFIIPERSPVAAGTGRDPAQSAIPQFPGDLYVDQGDGVNAAVGDPSVSHTA
jgi:hypothetical protein